MVLFYMKCILRTTRPYLQFLPRFRELMTSDDVVSKNTLSYDHDGNTFTPVLRKKKRRPGKQTHQRTPIELYEVSKQELTSDSVWINTCTGKLLSFGCVLAP